MTLINGDKVMQQMDGLNALQIISKAENHFLHKNIGSESAKKVKLGYKKW